MFRATKISSYIKAMRQQGISSKRLLGGTRIDPELVSNHDYEISFNDYETVIANMMKLTGNPGIAFLLGDVLTNIGELGILGYAMLSASSLRQALQVRIEYGSSIMDAPIRAESYRDTFPGYEVIVSSPATIGPLQRFEIEEVLVQATRRGEYLTGIAPVFQKVSFVYSEPEHHSLYESFCKCPVEFDAPQTMFRYLEPGLDTPIKTRNEELFQISNEHCRQIMRSAPETEQLRNRIRSLFLTTPGRLPDLKVTSAALGISVTTLRRHLEATHLSYQAIKDEFRYDLAREYLQSGYMSSKQVSYLLGFSTPSNFSRAFRDWSGQSVRQFLVSARKQ